MEAFVTALEELVRIAAPMDIMGAQWRAMEVCHKVGLDRAETCQVVVAVARLSNMLINASHSGRLSFKRLDRDGAVGLEVTAEPDGGGWRPEKAALPPGTGSLMDELGWSAVDGRPRLVAVKWRRGKA
jgi:hypothetical protein